MPDEFDESWGEHYSPATREHRERVHRTALEPARAVLAAIDALPEHVRGGVCWSLLTTPDSTLSAVAESLLEAEPEVALAHRLYFDAKFGGAEATANELSRTDEPWATIRAAVEAVVEAIHALGERTGAEIRAQHGMDAPRAGGRQGRPRSWVRDDCGRSPDLTIGDQQKSRC